MLSAPTQTDLTEYKDRLSKLTKYLSSTDKGTNSVHVTADKTFNKDEKQPIPYYFNVSYLGPLGTQKNDLYRIIQDGTIEELNIHNPLNNGWQRAAKQDIDAIVTAAIATQPVSDPEVAETKALPDAQPKKVLLLGDSTIDNKAWIGTGGRFLNGLKERLGIARDSIKDRIKQARRYFFKTELSVAEHLQEQLEKDNYEIIDRTNDGYTTKQILQGGKRDHAFPGGEFPISFPRDQEFKPLDVLDEVEPDVIVLSIGGNNFREFLIHAKNDAYHDWRKKTPQETKQYIEDHYDEVLKKLHDDYIDIVDILRARYTNAKIILMTQYYPSTSSTINYIYPFMSIVGQVLGKGTNPNNPLDVIHAIMKDTYSSLLTAPAIRDDPNIVIADVTSSLDPFDKNNHAMQIEPSGEGGKKMAKMLTHIILNSQGGEKAFQFLPNFFGGDKNAVHASSVADWRLKHPHEFTHKACYGPEQAIFRFNSANVTFTKPEIDEISKNEQLKNSIIILQQVSDYLRLPKANLLTTRGNFDKIKADTRLQTALSAAHNYWNSGRFGWLRTHGRSGKQQTANFVRNLLQPPDLKTSPVEGVVEDVIETKMRGWVQGSNVHNSSRLFYALRSGVFNRKLMPADQKDEALAVQPLKDPASVYVNATRAERETIRQAVLLPRKLSGG